MSETYTTGGPLGEGPDNEGPQVLSSYLASDCISMAFDRAGRIVATCVRHNTAQLFLIDPVTLAPLTYLDLSAKPTTGSEIIAGSYFYLDQRDRAFIPTIERTIWVVAEAGPDHTRFDRKQVYDLKAIVPENDSIASALPDFSGRLWFLTSGGLVGTINPDNGKVIGTLRLEGEEIHNSFAIDETGGVFIASDHAMYRFDAGKDGKPIIAWRELYDRGTRIKPGQFGQGTGTTPTLIGKEFVTIADNSDPYMHVLVYRRAKEVTGSRLVCNESVFGENKGDTENSLIATDKSIIVENNYGYSGPQATMQGNATEPGVTRIDINPDGSCGTVWNSSERVPNVVSKMSLANGLVYTYTKDPGPGTTDAWYFTAIDFETGKTVYKRLTGAGLYYNSHYAGVYLGPDGTAYVGVIGGLVAIRDPVMLGAGDNGRKIELNKGQTLVITLEANPTTGYTWEAAEFDEHVLRQVGEIEFQPESSAIGAGGVQILRFEAVNSGKTSLKLVYHRPWEKNVKPLKTFSLQVIVR
jgi:predicted secreted protein